MVQFFSGLVLTLFCAASMAQAQQYPDHPVHVIVGYARRAAGQTSRLARLGTTQHRSRPAFFVENRPGANGTIGTRAVVQSNPDGYTLLFSSNGIAPTPYIYKNLGYDIFTDLKPIATMAFSMACSCWSTPSRTIKPCRNSSTTPKKPRVRLAWCRQRPASCHRTLQQEGRHQDGARPVQGRVRSHDRHA